MAAAITDDRVVVTPAEVKNDLTANSITGLIGPVAVKAADAYHAQGTFSISFKVLLVGLGGASADFIGVTDVRDKHIFMWSNTVENYDIEANNGIVMGIGSAAGGATNLGGWVAGGVDKQIGTKNGFHSWCIDAMRPYDLTLGVAPSRAAAASTFFNWNFTTAIAHVNTYMDQISYGSKIFVKGGTLAVPGTSTDVASDDSTNGRGMFQDVGGVIYILGGVEIGDAAALSYFADSGKVWNFEDQNLSATFHKIAFVGGVAGVNDISFGTLVGTGITAEGSGGNTFQAGGVIPFRVESIDSNAAVNLYGCNMQNSPALKNDSWRRVFTEVAGPTFTDITSAANDATVSDAFPFAAAPAAGDAIYFGHDERIDFINFLVGIAGAGTYTVTWEYSTGAGTWAALTNVTDGSTAFKTVGASTLTYAIPDDWISSVVNATSRYWIRAVFVAGTQTTRAALTSTSAAMGGGLRWENANATAVSGTWTNMDTIRVRNGAILRKIKIVDSIAPAKSAALDLGAADPALDTIRDLNIIGAINGILLKGTSTGATAYNFRNIQFAGNTNDVMVDFPAAATITINILEGGISPTVNNINGSTVTIVANPVTLSVTALNPDTTIITTLDARVYVKTAAGGALPVDTVLINGFTDVTGNISDTRTYGADQPISGWIRKSTTSPLYKQFNITGTVTAANGLIINAIMVDDA